MKAMFLFMCLSLMMSFTAHAGFRAYQNNNGVLTDLKLFDEVQCGGEIGCSRVKNRLNIVSGGVRGNVLATAITLSSSQCGQTFYNGGAVEVDLPEASVVIGCRFTFVVLNASNFHIDPEASDIIMNSTNVAGDRALNATVGGVITLEAVSASQWAVLGATGTWTDAN